MADGDPAYRRPVSAATFGIRGECLGASLGFVTNFGDAAVILSLTMATTLYLLWSRWLRAALLFGVHIGMCAVVVALAKLAFSSCIAASLVPDLHSPSGHTAMSAATYGALAALFASRGGRGRAGLAHSCAHIVVVAIALSRVALSAHTPIEAMAGLMAGTLFAVLFAFLLGPPPSSVPRFRWLLALVAATLVVVHGAHLHVDTILHGVALGLRCA